MGLYRNLSGFILVFSSFSSEIQGQSWLREITQDTHSQLQYSANPRVGSSLNMTQKKGNCNIISLGFLEFIIEQEV